MRTFILLVLLAGCGSANYKANEKIREPGGQDFDTVTQLHAVLGSPCWTRSESRHVMRQAYCFCMVPNDVKTWKSTSCRSRCPVWIEYRIRGDVILDFIPKVAGEYQNDLSLLTCTK